MTHARTDDTPSDSGRKGLFAGLAIAVAVILTIAVVASMFLGSSNQGHGAELQAGAARPSPSWRRAGRDVLRASPVCDAPADCRRPACSTTGRTACPRRWWRGSADPANTDMVELGYHELSWLPRRAYREPAGGSVRTPTRPPPVPRPRPRPARRQCRRRARPRASPFPTSRWCAPRAGARPSAIRFPTPTHATTTCVPVTRPRWRSAGGALDARRRGRHRQIPPPGSWRRAADHAVEPERCSRIGLPARRGLRATAEETGLAAASTPSRARKRHGGYAVR